ncbi:type VI immunity family protein [Cupriavidus sp. SW-Y-13]|uniref:type VI immunity family protein n=1 Tax=Cupriavidus sp. SW-Y-13 TaxID=2653854 RepID=UPI001365D2E7|nr:type VI immunity family protein [Cupriavidus sp. SW-Y-13]
MTQIVTSLSPLTPTEAIGRYGHELIFADPSDGNRIVIRPALIGTLFFERGSQPAIRQALLHCFDKFRASYGEKLRGGKRADTTYSRKTTKGIESIRQYILSTDVNYAVEFVFCDATDYYTAPEYLIKSLTACDYHETHYGDLSYIKFILPWSFAESEEGLALYHAFMSFCCATLPVRGGYGGLSTVLPYDFDRYMPMEYQLAQRFTGLEVDSWGFAEAFQYEAGYIKSTNWYTVLGEPFVEKLGGEQTVRERLAREDIDIERCGNALIIRAGRFPLLGAPEEGPLDPYIFVNRVIKGLRNPLRKSMHSYMEGVESFAEEETRRWVARFDEPDAPMDDGTPQTSRGMSALPFQTCPRSGRWVANHLGNQIVHVKAGDFMPGPERSDAGNQVVWYLIHEAQ